MTFSGQPFAGTVRAVLCLAVLCAAFAAHPPAYAAQTAVSGVPGPAVIRRMNIEGTQRIEPSTVASYMALREGDPYDEFAADRSLKTLFGTGLFADVRMNWDGATLTVRVVENPIINRVALEGNYKISEKDLMKEVQIKPRQVFTRARVQADVQRIVELYRRSGRFAASVEPKIIQRPQNRVDVVFEINEGRATAVARIIFIGNKVFDDSTLKDQIVTSESAWWKFLSSSDNYDPDRLTFDREQLRRFYLKNGYADFRVVSAVAELTPDRSAFFITFTVDEGRLYRFGKISIDSQIKDLPVEELMPLIRAQQGETYNAELIDKSIEALTYAAGVKGFVFVDIRPRIQRSKSGRALDIVFRIEPGKRVYVEKINITGNARTRDDVIRREFRVAEGDAFNRVLIDRSRTRVRALGFFKDVEIKEEPGSAPDRTVLNVKVTEQATGEFSVGAGYSSQEQFLAQVSYTERNLFGRGQFLRASVSISAVQQQYSFGFTEPYFMGRPLAAGFSVYRTETDFTQADYFSSSNAASIFFGFPVSEYGRVTPRYTYRIDRLTAEKAAPLSVQLAEGNATTSLVGYTYSYDTRDDPIKPTKGLVFVLSQDFAGFGGRQKYLRSESNIIFYHEVFDPDWIGSLSVSAGYVAGYGGQDVRVNDRFFKGSSSFRGFEIAGVGPRIEQKCVTTVDATGTTVCVEGSKRSAAAAGAQAYAIGSLELRIPDFLPEDYGMSFAVFSDFGTVGLTPGKDVCDEFSCLHDDLALRASAGITLRWKSPFGPVQVDIGYPLMKEPYDKQQAINFSAGTTF
ncbi:MAG: outer membrane protein assembly factor BamA [Alphaproteobacteria bacterium]